MAEGTVVVGDEDSVAWWTFGGQKANAALAPAMANFTQVQATSDSLAIEFERALPLDVLQQAIEELRSRDPGTLLPRSALRPWKA